MRKCYYDALLCFSYQLSVHLEECVEKKNLFRVEGVLMAKLYYRILPFRVWNHLFLCERSQFNPDMCRFATKEYVSNKKKSGHINENLYVEINRFPLQLLEGIVYARKIYSFSHTNVMSSREDLFGINLGGVYYESISSPFLLWKCYLDLLSRIVFNVCYRHVLPLFPPNSSYGMCRKFTVCNSKNCRNLILGRIRELFHKNMVDFGKRIAETSCSLFNSYVVIDTFNNYRKGVDFFSEFLDIDQNE